MTPIFCPYGTQYVHGYLRKDGKYVQPHNRTIPSQPIDKNGEFKWRWKYNRITPSQPTENVEFKWMWKGMK